MHPWKPLFSKWGIELTKAEGYQGYALAINWGPFGFGLSWDRGPLGDNYGR